jgi:hypothetical protein
VSEAVERDFNWLQDLYMVGVLALMKDRTIVQAPLFDLPAKMVTGVLASGFCIPAAIAELTARATPEELGDRIRKPGTSVAIGLPNFPFMYLLGRTQRYLYAGWPESEVTLEDHDEATRVLDFFERMIRAYRTDGKISPHDEGATPGWPVLRGDEVAAMADRALAAGPPADPAKVRRALSRIETMIFLLHADARDGIWHHGPYDLGNDRVLILKEHTDLRGPYLPWVRGHELSVSKIVTPMVLESVECHIDAFGALRTTPNNYLDHCVGMTWLVDDSLEEITADRLIEIAEETGPAGRGLYREMMGWDAALKVSHGALQYANNMRGFFEAAGFTAEEIQRLLFDRFEAATEPYIDRFVAGDLDPQVFVYITAEPTPPLPSVAPVAPVS